MDIVHWLQGHLLSCPFKYLTGFDCPGCGFQRSFLALIQGDLRQSWALYPPTIPLLLVAAAGLLLWRSDTPYRDKILRGSYLFAGSFVFISYMVKLLA